MTTNRIRVPADLATCIHPGCPSRRWRKYTRCEVHQKGFWNENARKERASFENQPPLVDRMKPVRVLALDWQTQKLVWVEGRVVSEEHMPKTERELLAVLAEAGRDGVLVAKPQIYKPEDLQEER